MNLTEIQIPMYSPQARNWLFHHVSPILEWNPGIELIVLPILVKISHA